jgi:hypothetical protein
MFYSELNVFTCLNACGVYTELYVLCKKCVQIVTQCIKSLSSEKGTLQKLQLPVFKKPLEPLRKTILPSTS